MRVMDERVMGHRKKSIDSPMTDVFVEWTNRKPNHGGPDQLFHRHATQRCERGGRIWIQSHKEQLFNDKDDDGNDKTGKESVVEKIFTISHDVDTNHHSAQNERA